MRTSFAKVLVLISAGACFGCSNATAPPAAAPAPGAPATTPAANPASATAAPADAVPAAATAAAAPASTPADDPAVAAESNGHETPEAAFAALQGALGQQDWRTAAGCMTAESQEAMTAGLLLAGGLMAAFGGDQAADLTAALQKHGVEMPKPTFDFSVTNSDQPTEPAAEQPDPPPPEMPEIKDKAGFIADMLAALEKLDQGKSGQKHLQWAAAVLKDLAVDGDAATASIVMQGDDGEQIEQIEFRRGGGGWLVHLPENAFGMGPGGPGDGFSTVTDADAPPAGPLTEAVLEGGLTSTLSLTYEKPFESQFFNAEFPEGTLFATLNLVGEPILNAYEYGEFQITAITDDTGAALELAAPAKDQFDHEFGDAFIELNDFFLDKKDTLPILLALTPPAQGAKTIAIEAAIKLKVREALVVKDVLQSVGGELQDERLAGLGTFTVKKQSADNGEPDNGLILEVKAPDGTVEGIRLLNGQGEPLNVAGSFAFGFGSEKTFSVDTGEKLPPDTQLRIIRGGSESILVVPLKIVEAELP